MVSGYSISNELVQSNDGDRSAWTTVHKRRQQQQPSADSEIQTEPGIYDSDSLLD